MAGRQQKPGEGPGADPPSGPRREMRLLPTSASRRERMYSACSQLPSMVFCFSRAATSCTTCGLWWEAGPRSSLQMLTLPWDCFLGLPEIEGMGVTLASPMTSAFRGVAGRWHSMAVGQPQGASRVLPATGSVLGHGCPRVLTDPCLPVALCVTQHISVNKRPGFRTGIQADGGMTPPLRY